jgi:hypothetical protein
VRRGSGTPSWLRHVRSITALCTKLGKMTVKRAAPIRGEEILARIGDSFKLIQQQIVAFDANKPSAASSDPCHAGRNHHQPAEKRNRAGDPRRQAETVEIAQSVPPNVPGGIDTKRNGTRAAACTSQPFRPRSLEHATVSLDNVPYFRSLLSLPSSQNEVMLLGAATGL